jgi:DNA-binding NarL/FixJ family response regulator
MAGLTRIAFVDDDAKVLSGLRRALRGRTGDWELSFHDDPVAALEAFRSDPPTVAVLDIRMPQLDGIALAKAIRDQAPGTVCIILSGSTEFELAVASINEGHVFRFYVKPCEPDVLVEGIQEALRSRSRRSADTPGTPLLGDAAGAAADISSAALDLIPYGVIVLNGRGRALFSNARAGALLSAGAGLLLDAGGQCRAWRAADTDRLNGAIRKALGEGQTTALTLENAEGAPLRVTVQPYEGTAGGADRPVCLFLFSEDQARAPAPGLLIEMFGLTVSEARLAAALAQGMSLEEAAGECGVTKSSARTYLKSIFAKLGVTRQAELVRTILISIASG